MTLAELTEEEDRLRTQVGLVTGSMEERQAQLERLGVFDDYARVHAAYTKLAASGNAEALKRALFLQWYAVSEPSCFTGLSGLEPEGERCILEGLEGLASGDAFDSELKWMLPYYYAIADFHFDSHQGVPSLKRWLCEHASAAFPEDHLGDASLSGRGQMSDYWYRPQHTRAGL